MLDGPKQRPCLRGDVNRIIRMFNEIVESVSPVELEENFRLQEKVQHLANQLRLCRDLARSLDDWG